MTNIIVGAIAGGVAGAVGYFLANKFHNKEKAKTLYVVYMMAIFFPLNTILLNVFVPNNDFLQKMQVEMENNLSEESKKKIEEKNNPLYVRTLSQKGIKRLNTENLFLWNHLRLELSKKSKVMCSGLWSGKINDEETIKALELFTPAELADWIKISTLAIESELKNTNYYRTSAQNFQESLKDLAEQLNEDDRIKFATISQQGPNANDEDGCYALMIIMNYIEKNKNQNAEYLARHLAELIAQ